jgi:hypothetical protein
MKVTRSISLARSIRLVLVPIAALGVVAAIYLWSQQVKMEPSWQWARDLPPFYHVTDDDLERVFVPVDRQFTAVTDKDALVGTWTLHRVGAGEMAHPSHVTVSTPHRFRFNASGEALPQGTYGYHLSIPPTVLSEISHQGLLSLAIVDEQADELILVADRVEILQKEEEGAWLGLTMEQVAAVEALKRRVADAQEDGHGEPSGEIPDSGAILWTISQRANPDLPPLAVFEMALTAEGFDWGEGGP